MRAGVLPNQSAMYMLLTLAPGPESDGYGACHHGGQGWQSRAVC